MATAKDLPTQKWKRDTKYIHVNQGSIREGNPIRLRAIKGEISMDEAVSKMPDAITVKYNGTNTYGSTVIIRHPVTGEEVARFVHDPANPYSCGAQLVCITQMEVEVISRHPSQQI